MKRVFLVIFLIIAGFSVLPFKNYAADEAGEELKLYLSETKIISVNNPRRIVIGNPDIVDVANITKSEMVLSPRALGITTLVFWDSFGEQSYRIKVLSEDMTGIKRRIDNLLEKLNLPQVYTQAAEEEGKVLLLGRVKNPQDKETITVALGALKDKTLDLIAVKEEEAVIEIDVQVLELNKDATDTLGFTWPGTTGDITVTESSTPTTTAGDFSKLFVIDKFTRSAFSFTWRLDALIQEGKARILSRPRLACQSGKEAELLVGGEKPIFTTEVASSGGEGTEVEYKEYGIKLKIKPTITEKDRIKLALNVEVSEVGAAETIGSSSAPTAKAYPLTKRTATTELFLNNGETLAIGGLIKQKAEEDIRKTPGLGDVPLLGLFFRKKTTKFGGGQGERGDSELFITLTPTIITQKKEVEKKVIEEDGKKPKAKPIAYPSSAENISGPLAGYTNLIQKRLLENLAYPSLAKEAGFQGTVKLSLHLSYRGELLEVKVKESSGHNLLDDHAIAVAKRISSYPPFPSSIEQKELWIDIPILYQLD